MRTSDVIPDDAQDQFWAVVEQCIREFHKKRLPSAIKKMIELRQKLMKVPLEDYELFFHSEPFDVACALAGRRLRNADEITSRYHKLGRIR